MGLVILLDVMDLKVLLLSIWSAEVFFSRGFMLAFTTS